MYLSPYNYMQYKPAENLASVHRVKHVHANLCVTCNVEGCGRNKVERCGSFRGTFNSALTSPSCIHSFNRTFNNPVTDSLIFGLFQAQSDACPEHNFFTLSIMQGDATGGQRKLGRPTDGSSFPL